MAGGDCKLIMCRVLILFKCTHVLFLVSCMTLSRKSHLWRLFEIHDDDDDDDMVK